MKPQEEPFVKGAKHLSQGESFLKDAKPLSQGESFLKDAKLVGKSHTPYIENLAKSGQIWPNSCFGQIWPDLARFDQISIFFVFFIFFAKYIFLNFVPEMLHETHRNKMRKHKGPFFVSQKIFTHHEGFFIDKKYFLISFQKL